MEGFVHPTVRRGQIFWWGWALCVAVGTVWFGIQALRDPTSERLLFLGLLILFTLAMAFNAVWQVRILRREFRYENEDESKPASSDSRDGH